MSSTRRCVEYLNLLLKIAGDNHLSIYSKSSNMVLWESRAEAGLQRFSLYLPHRAGELFHFVLLSQMSEKKMKLGMPFKQQDGCFFSMAIGSCEICAGRLGHECRATWELQGACVIAFI